MSDIFEVIQNRDKLPIAASIKEDVIERVNAIEELLQTLRDE